MTGSGQQRRKHSAVPTWLISVSLRKRPILPVRRERQHGAILRLSTNGCPVFERSHLWTHVGKAGPVYRRLQSVLAWSFYCGGLR